MGNYKFRLSDMMPNAWFYKLKDMSRGVRNQSIPHFPKRIIHHSLPRTTPNPFPQPPTNDHSLLPSRASYYFPSRPKSDNKSSHSSVHPKASDTHFPADPPRKSKRRPGRKPVSPSTKLISSSVSSGCSCRVWRSEAASDFTAAEPLESPPFNYDNDDDDDFHKPIITADQFEFDSIASWSHPCSCSVTSSATDIVIDVGKDSSLAGKLERIKGMDSVSQLELRPILTKPEKREQKQSRSDGSNVMKNPARKPLAGIHRLRMRASSPKLVSKKVPTSRNRRSLESSAAKQRKGLSESFAVVKKSSDPQRDFMNSMMEMIIENDIRASKDLEELLACYLSLNSNEYHDLIVKVFEQIWLNLMKLDCK